MQAAVKLRVTIPQNRRVQLPEELPEGQAEIIVLYAEPNASAEKTTAHAIRKGAKGTKRSRRVPGPDPRATARSERVNYFARLVAYQPLPLSPEASRALDEADRGER